jgi:hypothetical protein
MLSQPLSQFKPSCPNIDMHELHPFVLETDLIVEIK